MRRSADEANNSLMYLTINRRFVNAQFADSRFAAGEFSMCIRTMYVIAMPQSGRVLMCPFAPAAADLVINV